LVIAGLLVPASCWALPDGFVDLQERVPGIMIELRYASNDNFVGRPVEGYQSGQRVVMTAAAAQALARVQAELAPFGLGLKVFDAYRPQRAVNDFVHWAVDVNDQRNKQEYYPQVDKRDLFKLQYIAHRSGHTRGSTVDLTLVSLPDGKALDMGSNFDFFGEQSWVNHPDLSAQQRANRMLLQQVMTRYGFIPYRKEWWHFTLRDEPYPDTYFDFLPGAAKKAQ
jgi:D-alanyl-D-alanine dipeptidase